MEAAVCREGNPVQRLRDEGVGKAGLVAVKVLVKWPRGRVGPALGAGSGSGTRLRAGLGRGGLGFGGGIAWLFTCGLVLLFAKPLSGVDICVRRAGPRVASRMGRSGGPVSDLRWLRSSKEP